jgi:hypothetical protein
VIGVVVRAWKSAITLENARHRLAISTGQTRRLRGFPTIPFERAIANKFVPREPHAFVLESRSRPDAIPRAALARVSTTVTPATDGRG